jgi:hypothetical protein
MFVSGIVGTALLGVMLVVLLLAGVALAAVDKYVDAGRLH